MAEGRILALDVGDHHIGIAITDELEISVYPVKVLVRDGDEINEICSLITEKGVKKIIVGLPKNLKGEIGPQAQKVLQFAEVLKEHIEGLELIFWDERLTSVIAHRIFKSENVNSRKERKIKDSLEAVLILESYLDSECFKEGQ